LPIAVRDGDRFSAAAAVDTAPRAEVHAAGSPAMAPDRSRTGSPPLRKRRPASSMTVSMSPRAGSAGLKSTAPTNSTTAAPRAPRRTLRGDRCQTKHSVPLRRRPSPGRHDCRHDQREDH
jgi:hypothetical protein